MYLNETLERKPLVSVRNGHIVHTDYDTITVALDKSLTAEEGTLTFADPGGLNSGDTVAINFSFVDITNTAQQNTYIADVGATARIKMPFPMPANVAEYLAEAFRQHHIFLANAVTSLAGSVITYRVIRPGIRLDVVGTPTAAVTQASTVTATNGGVPNIGGGSAVFFRPGENNASTPTITPFKASLGYASAAVNALYYGSLRAGDNWQFLNEKCYTTVQKCSEVMRRGQMQVPIEEPVGTIPDNPVLQARYAVDGAFTVTGTYKVVDAGTAAGTGLIDVPNAELIAVVDAKSILMRLR